jgi:DNA adenine methylase
MITPLETYPGRKGAAGVWQTIISEIPKCKVFVDAMCGSGIIGSKVNAETVLFNDIDSKVITQLEERKLNKNARFTCYNYEKLFTIFSQTQDVVFYFDPPYLFDTRSSKQKIYSYEWSDNDHIRFLATLQHVKRPVLVSHYPCTLYNEALKNWRIVQYDAMTHTGIRKENLYMNFAPPVLLQAWQHVGENFTDRQRIKRKIESLEKRLNNLTQKERAAILSALVEKYTL